MRSTEQQRWRIALTQKCLRNVDAAKPGQFLVYLVVCKITGLPYVGIVHGKQQTIAKRWREHCKNALAGANNKLETAIRKYGKSAFYLRTIAKASSLQQLTAFERKYVRYYSALTNGYNGTYGGGPAVPAAINSVNTKRRWQEPEYRKRTVAILAANRRKRWARKGERARASEFAKQQWRNPVFRKRQTARLKHNLKVLWADPEFRKVRSALVSSQMKKRSAELSVHMWARCLQLWQDPAWRKLHSEKAKRQWKNPAFRKKVLTALQKGYAEHFSKAGRKCQN